jgi:hypothetical protein
MRPTQIEPGEIFADLEREQGLLSTSVTKSKIKYQSSNTHPGCLEQIDESGQITVGRWENGEFIPLFGS